MKYLVLSCSLNPESRSEVMAKHAFELLKKKDSSCEFLSLKDYPLPLCDSDEAYSHKHVATLQKKISESKCILLGAPVYNYDLNSAAKNLMELTGKAWTEKIVGFLISAGGQGSYMSPISFANSLMFDFRSIIIPRFVYATGSAFNDEKLSDEKVMGRIQELVEQAVRFTEGLH